MACWVLLIGFQHHQNHTNHMIVTITMTTNKTVKLKYPLSRLPTQSSQIWHPLPLQCTLCKFRSPGHFLTKVKKTIYVNHATLFSVDCSIRQTASLAALHSKMKAKKSRKRHIQPEANVVQNQQSHPYVFSSVHSEP